MDAEQIRNPQFWQSFAPRLHIQKSPVLSDFRMLQPTPELSEGLKGQIKQEGYFHIQQVDWDVDLKLMADTVRALSAAGLSPVFAFMYDEFWIPFYKLHAIYSSLIGPDYLVLPDFWIWDVDPKRGESGWRPHRDRSFGSLLPDGSPKSLTTWIPISQATPLNGCMYIVPANFDPTYGTPNDKEWKFEYSSIRALPGNPGDFFIWNQAVLHWGSKTSPRAMESRVSMAFEFQRADVPAFNSPTIKPLSILNFDDRLKLIAKQILQYRHMYKVAPGIEQVAQRILDMPVAQPA
jgi:hypothetical protein